VEGTSGLGPGMLCSKEWSAYVSMFQDVGSSFSKRFGHVWTLCYTSLLYFAKTSLLMRLCNGKDESQDVTAMPPCKGAPWARVVSDLANTVRSRRVTAQKKIRKRLIKLIKLIMFQYVSICFIDLMLDMPESC